MAKKKEIGDGGLGIEKEMGDWGLEISVLSDESFSGAGFADEEKPYVLGSWNGMRQWRCRQCAWDTLQGEAAMLAHIAAVHAPPKPQGGILIADKSGKSKR